MLPVALSSNTSRHAVAKQRDPPSKYRAAVNTPEPEQKHVEVECNFNFFSPPTAAANAYLSKIRKVRRVRYHPKPKRTSEQTMSATRAIYSLRCFHHLFETKRISPPFSLQSTAKQKKNVNYKKRLLSLMLSPESGDWYPTSAPGMLVLVSFLDFFCSPLKRLASSLVAVLVSEWCSM